MQQERVRAVGMNSVDLKGKKKKHYGSSVWEQRQQQTFQPKTGAEDKQP